MYLDPEVSESQVACCTSHETLRIPFDDNESEQTTSQRMIVVVETTPECFIWLARRLVCAIVTCTIIRCRLCSLVLLNTSTYKQLDIPLDFTSAPSDHILRLQSLTSPLDITFRRDLQANSPSDLAFSLSMCTFTFTIYACGHLAEAVFLSELCTAAQPFLACWTFSWHFTRLKHWTCAACGGSGQPLGLLA